MTSADSSRRSCPPKAIPRYAGTILWDFDGTLVWRPSMWSRALHHALTDFGLDATITAAEVERWFESGFPWQRLEHPELNTAEKWWREAERGGMSCSRFDCARRSGSFSRVLREAESARGISRGVARRDLRDG